MGRARRPYLHLSCEGAWNQVEQDEEAYIAIIDKITAVGFLNHDFDIAKLEALPEDELEAVRVEYYTSIGDLCREDPRNLLAGIVEEALVEAFSMVDPESTMH